MENGDRKVSQCYFNYLHYSEMTHYCPKIHHVGVSVYLNFEHRKSKNKTDESALSDIISKKSETTLDLVSKMTSVTNRIDLKSVNEMFGRLRTGRKIKLSEDLTNSVDSIISNNMTAKMEEYTDELSEMR